MLYQNLRNTGMRIKQNVCSKLWTDTNIDFRNQEIRHCCKSVGHKLSFEEMDDLGVNVFENYNLNVENKKLMLEQNKIPEHSCRLCAYNGDNAIRHSWNTWSDEFINTARPTLLTDDKVGYIEIDIGDQCDLACVYCGPWSSTTWKKEQGQKVQDKTQYAKDWTNRVIDLLVKRIDQVDKSEHLSINFLGGEPTLMPEVYTLIDSLAPVFATFDKRVNLMFTSNINTKGPLFERLIETIKATKDFAYWTVGVSIDNVGPRAELVRYGLNWQRFHNNLMELQHHCKIALTCTHNYFSLPHFDETLDYFFNNLTTEFNTEEKGAGWLITSNCVYDNVLDPAYLEQDFVPWDRIYAKLDQYIGRGNEPAGLNSVYLHTDNMRKRVGTKQVNRRFYQYHKNISMRTPGYFEQFPYYKQTMERIEPLFQPGQPEGFGPGYFDKIWQTPVNPSDDPKFLG